MKWTAKRSSDSSLNVTKALVILEKPMKIIESLTDFINDFQKLNSTK